MMPESIQEFSYSSMGAKTEYDSIIADLRAMVSNKVLMAIGPIPMEADRVAVDATDGTS